MGVYWGNIGVILGVVWGYIGLILGVYWVILGYSGGYIGIMENKMETTIQGLGLNSVFMGFLVPPPGVPP